MTNAIHPQLPLDFDPEIVAGIRQRLDNARNQGVTILFAIESGSRAWGFPSPDSDYDCRFVYVRPISDHLSLQPDRDVIEFPIECDLDVGGWDLKKALLLALGGNAVIGEWADSAICYEEVPEFRSEMKETLDQIIEPVRVSHHYLGLARSGITRHNPANGEIKLKKLFYILRPLVALQWMEQHGFAKLPPMDFNKGLAEIELDAEVRELIGELLAMKAKTREIGTGEVPKVILDYVSLRFSYFNENVPATSYDAQSKRNRTAIAQAFYENAVRRFDG
ncbi:MAG: nucleotidyltransferase domain-containing protein [Rhizobiaceae bacterium]|nr:nucleotidyltransferase domain-containing protein [Rhizobiaceae bacterium]